MIVKTNYKISQNAAGGASRHNGMKVSGCPDGRTPLKVQSGEMSGRNIYSEQQTNLSDKHIVSRYSQGFGLSS